MPPKPQNLKSMIEGKVMKTFNELRTINVNEHIEKKGKFNYLSWTWAVDQLLQNDPSATWEFKDPVYFAETLMVFCSVTAFGKTMNCQMPVIDSRNKAIPNPNAMDVNTAMMRCLTKCISLFGIGLYIYAGEDLPNEEPVDLIETAEIWAKRFSEVNTMDELKNAYSCAYEDCKKDKNAVVVIAAAKDKRKAELS